MTPNSKEKTSKPSTIDRRGFVKWMGLAGVTGLAGCSGSDQDSTTTGSNDSSGGEATATATSGESEATQHVRVASAETPNTLNPIKSRTSIGWVAHNWMYSNLTRYDSDLSIHPDLATDWEVNADADEFTFLLRDDAQFQHNGRQVVASDVKATLDAIYDPEFASPGKGALGPIESVDVVDETTVTVNTSTPFSDLPKMMAVKYPRIVPAEVIENDFDSLSSTDYGSGPFVLEEAEFGTQFTFTANDNYYMQDEDENQLPHIDEITIQIMPEISSRMTALQNSEIEMVGSVPPEQWQRVQGMSNVETAQIPGGRHYPIDMRTDTEPFDDNRVRQAVKYAIDKRDMLNVVNNGFGVIAQHNQISPAHQFYADLDDKFGVEARPEEAERLLAEAGYEDGVSLDFPMVVPTEIDAQVERTAILAQEQLQQVGIEFDIERVPWETFLADYTSDAPLTTTVWSMRTVEYELMYLLNHSEGGLNAHTRFDDPEFDTALENAAAATTQEAKAEAYEKCQRIVRDRGGYVIPFFGSVLGAWQSSVKNFELDPTLATIKLQDVELDQS